MANQTNLRRQVTSRKARRLSRRDARQFLSPLRTAEEFARDVDYLRGRLSYNPETGLFTRRVTANGWLAGQIAGVQTRYGYVKVGLKGWKYFAHHLAWIYVHGSFPTSEVDHINGDRTDNRIANLRCVDRATNCQNIRTPKSTNKLGLIGVTQYRAGGKTRFKATIVVGSYDTPEEAHEAYLRAKTVLHGGWKP